MQETDTADAYARLSKNRDGRKESCARQLREIDQAAARNGHRITYKATDDNFSAWKRNVKRPGWEAILQRIDAGLCRILYIYSYDRMMRQPRDLEELIDRAEKRGLIVVTAAGAARNLSDYSDRHYLRGEIAAAVHYSDANSAKSKSAHRELAEAGHPHAGGMRPFGFRLVTGRMMPDPDEPGEMIPAPATYVVDLAEAESVRMIYSEFLAGASPGRIAEKLHAAGVSTVTGVAWTSRAVKKLLQSGAPAGLRLHHGVVAAVGTWEPIVPRGQWEEAQRMLAERAAPSPAAKNEYLLSGLVFCGREGCGRPMRTMSGGRKGYPSYSCSARQGFFGCGRVDVSSARVDLHVARRLATIVDDPDAARPGEGRELEVAAARVARDAARAKLAEIAEDYGADRMTREERDVARRGPAARLEAAEKVLAERRPDLSLITQGKRWVDMDFPHKRAVARACVERVVVAPLAAPNGGKWDASRVHVDWR